MDQNIYRDFSKNRKEKQDHTQVQLIMNTFKEIKDHVYAII